MSNASNLYSSWNKDLDVFHTWHWRKPSESSSSSLISILAWVSETCKLAKAWAITGWDFNGKDAGLKLFSNSYITIEEANYKPTEVLTEEKNGTKGADFQFHMIIKMHSCRC